MVNVALVGVGYWGPNIARSLEQSGRARLSWICDTQVRALKTMAERYPKTRLTTQLDEVLADSTVQGVCIATPTNTHFSIASQVMRTGRHVLLEKPLTHDISTAIALVNLAAENNVILMVGHIFEYNNAIRETKKLIHSGELGEIHYINFERTNLGPVRQDVNALWDLASHDVSIMRYLLEEEPVAVSAYGHAYLNPGVEDVVFAVYSFQSHCLVHIHASWLNPRKVRQITIVGSKKMVVVDDLDIRAPIRVYDKHVDSQSLMNISGEFLGYKMAVVDGGLFIPSITMNQPLLTELEHFLDCIQNQKTALSDGLSGLHVVRALDAASQSIARKGCLVPILPYK